MSGGNAAIWRVGQGIDFHRLVANRELWLGGVKIDFDRGLEGHSDADVLLHAITDAILGAAGCGDIGTFFPNTDDKWRDAKSAQLLQIAWQSLWSQGWRVANLDATLVAEAPKISGQIEAMKAVIAPILGVEPSAIGIKATTSEGLGFTGRGEGMMAMCVACLQRC